MNWTWVWFDEVLFYVLSIMRIFGYWIASIYTTWSRFDLGQLLLILVNYYWSWSIIRGSDIDWTCSRSNPTKFRWVVANSLLCCISMRIFGTIANSKHLHEVDLVWYLSILILIDYSSCLSHRLVLFTFNSEQGLMVINDSSYLDHKVNLRVGLYPITTWNMWSYWIAQGAGET
jgi:hypothetical protein